MTKKFTEKEYQKIVDCFNWVHDDYNLGLMNDNLIRGMQHALDSDFDLVNDWAEIVAIANPATRQEAKEQFVEEEKKYIWQLKPLFDDDDEIYLNEYENGIISYTIHSNRSSPLAESKVRQWGYNPDMFDREEVE